MQKYTAESLVPFIEGNKTPLERLAVQTGPQVQQTQTESLAPFICSSD